MTWWRKSNNKIDDNQPHMLLPTENDKAIVAKDELD